MYYFFCVKSTLDFNNLNDFTSFITIFLRVLFPLCIAMIKDLIDSCFELETNFPFSLSIINFFHNTFYYTWQNKLFTWFNCFKMFIVYNYIVQNEIQQSILTIKKLPWLKWTYCTLKINHDFVMSTYNWLMITRIPLACSVIGHMQKGRRPSIYQSIQGEELC